MTNIPCISSKDEPNALILATFVRGALDILKFHGIKLGRAHAGVNRVISNTPGAVVPACAKPGGGIGLAAMTNACLRLEERRIEGGQLTVAACLEHPDRGRARLWWQLPAEWSDSITTWADPFVIGLVFPMMQWGHDVDVAGRVSPSLLENIERFMAVWHCWMPDKYRPVGIRASEEVEPGPPAGAAETVLPFSCGVDSCFSLLRHRRELMGRRNRRITAGVVMNGFDIRLDQANTAAIYSGLLRSAKLLLGSLDVACIPMTSNFHELPTAWKHSFCTHLVSGLSLLAGRFGSMMIPNNVNYGELRRVWGSHPVSDPLLASRSFHVTDDGADYNRPGKIGLLTQWPEAMRYLRVCFVNPDSHANCCRCEKCIRTILSFRAAGCGLPPAFNHDVTDRQIRRTRLLRDNHMNYWLDVIRAAERNSMGGASWVRSARAAVRRSRRRRMWDRLKRPLLPLRNAVRVLFRGSALGRRQLADQARKQG